MTQVAIHPEVKDPMTLPAPRPEAKKKGLRVAIALTGAVVGTAPFVAATPAHAASRNYEIVVHTNSAVVWQLQFCGYNQNGTWICTPGDNVHETYHLNGDMEPESVSYSMPGWWWHGHIKLWWNSHHSKSWNQCYIPSRYLGSIYRSKSHYVANLQVPGTEC
jgi:hypothetical protein